MFPYFDFLVFIATIFLCLLMYFKWKYSYWRNKNVPYLEPRIPFGTLENPFSRKLHTGISAQLQYNYFKSSGHKYGGLYSLTIPSLLAVDVDFIKNILLKDFQHFTDRGMFLNEKKDPLSANLFNLGGLRWRHMRAKLTPTFTSGKLKMMFPTLVACGEPLCTAVNEMVNRREPVDIKDVLACYTTDVIGSCAFGLECNSFKKPEGEFRKFAKIIFSKPTKIQVLKFLIISSNPWLARRLSISRSSLEPKKFFLNVVKDTVAYRTNNNIVRNDFMQLLMDLQNHEEGADEGLTVEQIAAQAFVFFLAGFETSSTTMTFCLYELAMNQEIQDKVREEISTVLNKYDGNVTYDGLMDMKYLHQVVDETLRKYPPASVLLRVCVADYQIPKTDIRLEKGTRVIVPIYALHHDPEFFSDPEKFNPERFCEVNKHKIRPFTYMPFGEGPRNCIGLRFGLLQTQVGLIILLKRFKFLLNDKTKSPLKFDSQNIILTAEGGIWLNIEKV